jgi:hypothetical protein
MEAAMSRRPEISKAELAEIRARNPVADVAGGYVHNLRRMGKRLTGPCPLCGGGPRTTRFEIFEDGESWACAACNSGGDVITLVRNVENLDFPTAIERLGGRIPVDPKRAEQLAAEHEKKRLEREEQSAKFREKERRRLFELWETAVPIGGTLADEYLRGRGIELLPLCPGLRFLPKLKYYHGEQLDDRGRKQPVCIHQGWAMLGAFIRPDGHFGGLHMTWGSRDNPPRKAEIIDPETGEQLNSKKMRGSKSGARIWVGGAKTPRRLFVGEGIETVGSVMTAYVADRRSVEDTAFWAAGDLGNLAGKAVRTVRHPTLKRPSGVAQTVPNDEPDPADPGLAIPDSVDELILLGDGDSEPLLTQNAMTRAARRYARPGRTIRIAFAPAGNDFNDVLQGEAA